MSSSSEPAISRAGGAAYAATGTAYPATRTAAPTPGTAAPTPGTAAPTPGTAAPTPGTAAPTPGAAATRPSKRERTLAALLESGLDLFERQGYEQTTVAEIARAAGVTEMTFFRYFPAKEHLLLDDPYDPVLIEAIARQPRDSAPLLRAARGIRSAWRALPEPETPIIRRRVRIAAATPALRGAMWRSTGNTERAIVEQLIADGAARDVARVAAASVLAALVAGLFIWAEDERRSLAEAIEQALDVIEVAA